MDELQFSHSWGTVLPRKMGQGLSLLSFRSNNRRHSRHLHTGQSPHQVKSRFSLERTYLAHMTPGLLCLRCCSLGLLIGMTHARARTHATTNANPHARTRHARTQTCKPAPRVCVCVCVCRYVFTCIYRFVYLYTPMSYVHPHVWPSLRRT